MGVLSFGRRVRHMRVGRYSRRLDCAAAAAVGLVADPALSVWKRCTIATLQMLRVARVEDACSTLAEERVTQPRSL